MSISTWNLESKATRFLDAGARLANADDATSCFLNHHDVPSNTPRMAVSSSPARMPFPSQRTRIRRGH